MPVVRELVNLFTFKQDKAGLKESEKSFNSLAKTAAGIGAAMVAGVATATLKMVPAIEKARAEAEFFGKSIEPLDELLKNREVGGFYSVTQLANIRAELSKLSIGSKQAKEALEFLKDIRVARGFSVSLDDLAGTLKGALSDDGSDIVSTLRELGGISVEYATLLSRNKAFGESFNKALPVERMRVILDVLRKNEDRIKGLAAKQENTLTAEIERFETSFSNISLKVGDTFKDTMIEALKTVNQIIEALMSSDSLWKSLESVSKLFVDTSKWYQAVFGGEGVDAAGKAYAKNRGIDLSGKTKDESVENEGKSSFDYSNIGGEIKSNIKAGRDAKEDARNTFSRFREMWYDSVNSSRDSVQKTLGIQKMEVEPINVNINGSVEIKGQGPQSSGQGDFNSAKPQIIKLIKDVVAGEIGQAANRKGIILQSQVATQ
jgi:hypothetical protein